MAFGTCWEKGRIVGGGGLAPLAVAIYGMLEWVAGWRFVVSRELGTTGGTARRECNDV